MRAFLHLSDDADQYRNAEEKSHQYPPHAGIFRRRKRQVLYLPGLGAWHEVSSRFGFSDRRLATAGRLGPGLASVRLERIRLPVAAQPSTFRRRSVPVVAVMARTIGVMLNEVVAAYGKCDSDTKQLIDAMFHVPVLKDE